VKVVIFGVAVSSYSENPLAVPWPALIRELHSLGHHIDFFQQHGAQPERLEQGFLIFYPDWQSVRTLAATKLADCDAAIVTSETGDVALATRLALDSNARVRCFYDLDPAATLRSAGAKPSVPPDGLAGFDVVLSTAGGKALAALKSHFHARHVMPLYPWVDRGACRQDAQAGGWVADLFYPGEWRRALQPAIDSLFLEPARRRPDLRFVATGSPAGADFEIPDNVRFVPEVRAEDLPRLYSSSRLALLIADPAAAAMGYCPSAEMFAAAACGAPLLTDDWDGMDYFFEAGREILVARTTGHVMDALALPFERLAEIGRAGRERVLSAHTAARRALDLENILEAAISLPAEHAGFLGQ
jgi:spore maturation protein CgeB